MMIFTAFLSLIFSNWYQSDMNDYGCESYKKETYRYVLLPTSLLGSSLVEGEGCWKQGAGSKVRYVDCRELCLLCYRGRWGDWG